MFSIRKFLFNKRYGHFEASSIATVCVFTSQNNNFWFFLLLIPIAIITVIFED